MNRSNPLPIARPRAIKEMVAFPRGVSEGEEIGAMCSLLETVILCHTRSCTIFRIAAPHQAFNFCSLSYECVGIATSFSVAIASSALHRLVTVFHCV